jgi:hypothetical protein
MTTYNLHIANVNPGAGVYFSPLDEERATQSYNPLVAVFPDGSTDIALGFSFIVPQQYTTSGTTTLKVYWSADATTGDVRWSIGLRAVASGEGTDQSGAQQTVAGTTTTDATAEDLNITTLTFTASNFAAGDLVNGALTRVLSNAADTLATDAVVHAIVFSYDDA